MLGVAMLTKPLMNHNDETISEIKMEYYILDTMMAINAQYILKVLT